VGTIILKRKGWRRAIRRSCSFDTGSKELTAIICDCFWKWRILELIIE